jgi:hypothetical protein
MMVYGIPDIISGIFGILLAVTSVPDKSLLALIVLVAQVTGISLQILVWAMPERFRLWVNQDTRPRPYTQEQRVLSVLDIFAQAMTDHTGLKSMACHYAIRAAVGKKLGTEDSDAIQKYLNFMTFYEWNAIIQHPELRRILINSGADHASANRAIENAHNALVEKQSVLTFSAR